MGPAENSEETANNGVDSSPKVSSPSSRSSVREAEGTGERIASHLQAEDATEGDESKEGSIAVVPENGDGENRVSGIPTELRLRRDDNDQSSSSMPSLVSFLGNSFHSQSSTKSAAASSVFECTEYSSIPSIATIKTFQTTESEVKTVKHKNFKPGVVTPKQERRWETSESAVTVSDKASRLPTRGKSDDATEASRKD